jgi:copper chaperone CopZ
MDQAKLSIEGMSCGHCVAQVKRTLEALPGVTTGEVKIGSADLTFDPARTPMDRIVGALEEEGYPAQIADAG